jgi:hypothetical protein
MTSSKLSLLTVAILALYFGNSFSQIFDGSNRETWKTGFPGSGVGMTSPLADCTALTGCTKFSDAHPVVYIQTVSARSLVVGLAADTVDPSAVAKHFGIKGLNDLNNLTVESVGHSRVTVGFDENEKALTELRLHILLAQPLIGGQRYRLNLSVKELQTLEFAYLSGFITPSIQVNQLGYLPTSNKQAFAGNWLGTTGPMPIDEMSFTVTDSTSGQTVFQSELEKVTGKDAWSGNAVYRAEFSEVKTEGGYFLSIPGLGKSQTFRISKDVFRPVHRKVFRLFYHSRNSTAISSPWADPGFERPSGIAQELSALIHPAVTTSAFSSGEKAGSYKMIRRGWFDAGDYGQYVVNAAPVWYAFATGMDLMPSVFMSDDLNLPESNNGIPDMIDELEWGMDWLLDMQNTDNGGVYSRLVPLLWDEALPQDVTQPRYLFEITSHATASFAAMTALHARLLTRWNPQRAAHVLEASRSAWAFLENTRQWPAEGEVYQNPKDVHAGEYPDKSATDNRLWAAAELYRTTGELEFKKAFIDLLNDFNPDPTEGVTFKSQAMAAYWSMYKGLKENAQASETSMKKSDTLLQTQLAKVLVSAADWYLRKADEHPFNAPMHQHMPFTGWGSFAHSSRAILPLLQASAISGDRKYCSRAAEMSNPQLGANPQSVSYITGIGSRSPRHPLSMLSKFDKQRSPLNGIPVNGPHYHLPALWPSTRTVNDTYLPPIGEEVSAGQTSYPALRRYVDSFLLPPMSEPTVAEYAVTVVAYGLLTDEALLCAADR